MPWSYTTGVLRALVDLPRIELGSGQCECPVLPLNHRPKKFTLSEIEGWTGGDSNSQPPPCHGGTLPLRHRPAVYLFEPESQSRRPEQVEGLAPRFYHLVKIKT